MLTVETKIQGVVISYLYVVNTGISTPDGVLYKAEYFMPQRNPLAVNFDFVHKPEEKAEKLLAICYAHLFETLKDTR